MEGRKEHVLHGASCPSSCEYVSKILSYFLEVKFYATARQNNGTEDPNQDSNNNNNNNNIIMMNVIHCFFVVLVVGSFLRVVEKPRVKSE
jgi:hypothetical protein